jgi:hypothetical protein
MTAELIGGTMAVYHGRAKEDYSQSAELLRSGVQFVFAANGGASVAVMSCLTAITTAKELNSAFKVSAILPRFTLAVAIFLIGVLLAALALGVFSMSKEAWGHFWEDNALTGEVDFNNAFAARGSHYSKVGRVLFLLSAIAFVSGSGVGVTAFLP